ncbi:MAG: CPXCG motif-containing cysteine-rich protein, partial [Deltaproteobacteria bacterium]|nr:CPXCG motif-containing cysteine-rich protein [Deltaproteobacteria bacterium]
DRRATVSGQMGEMVCVNCPFCGEDVEILITPEDVGSMVQDCEVCCRPWKLSVSWDDDGPSVAVDRA